MRSLTILDFVHAMAAAIEHRRDFGWHVAPGGVPGGRFYLDHESSTLYLDAGLTGDQALAAFVEAVDELITGTTDATVVPLHRYAIAATHEALDGRAVEGLGS